MLSSLLMDTLDELLDGDDEMDASAFSTQQLLHAGKGCRNRPEDVEAMRRLLATDPFALERREPHFASELTPLQHAISKGHWRCVRFLLEAGADVTVETRNDNQDVMMLAIGSQQDSIVEALLQHGVSPNYLRHQVNLSSAWFNKSFYVTQVIDCYSRSTLLQLLLDAGAEINDFAGHSINFDNFEFFVAAANCIGRGHAKRLKFLLLRGAPVDSRDANLPSPTDPVAKDCLSLVHHLVCCNGSGGFEQEKLVLDILYQFGANLWERNRLGLTPLQMRCNRKLWNKERNLRGLSWHFDRPREGVFYLITEHLKQLMAAPMSLSSLCRLTLFKAVGPRHYLQRLDSLPVLPTAVKSYLRFEDVPEVGLNPEFEPPF